MNKIKEVLQSREEPLLNIGFTAGFPEKNITIDLIKNLSRHGADHIEICMPYSDPLADGPTIQQSSALALKNGMTLEVLFNQVGAASQQVDTPLILMGYLNQMMQYGEERFLQRCKETGISGLIVPDLPPELFKDQYQTMFSKNGIEAIFLITPQTSEERIRMIDELSDSFIYVVSDSSITGKSKAITKAQKDYFSRVSKMNLKNSTLIGFGISDHESFMEVNQYASGAIIASAFIQRLKAEYGEKDINDIVQDFINEIKSGQ